VGVSTSGFEGWQDRARPSGSSRTRAAASTAFEAAMEGHGRSQRIRGGQENDLLSQHSAKYRPHRPHRPQVLISTDFVRAVLSQGIDRQWTVTERHGKYRPRIDRQISPRFAGIFMSLGCRGRCGRCFHGFHIVLVVLKPQAGSPCRSLGRRGECS
jgi:hypothetical protein